MTVIDWPMNQNSAPFLTLEHITVRYLDRTLFTNLSWEILEGQQWAITGHSGSGKSALLSAIAGRFNIINGAIRYHFYEAYRQLHPPTDPYFSQRDLMAQVAHHHNFRNRSNTTDFYYQQRFNSMDSGDAPTVRQYLYGDEGAPADDALLEPLRITPLLDRELIKLSNGETRRVMIARALLQKPLLLMLDSPFTGLDVQARKDFMEMVNRIIANGTTVLLVTSATEIPSNITHVLTLDGGHITGKYTREDFLQLPQPAEAPPAAAIINASRLRELVKPAGIPCFNTIVQMENIRVKYDGQLILDNINWTVKPNEKWALLGPNGAGKSTLLSLINADNPQAYANHLYLFDRKRGSGESIWDIKRKIGFVSPELHQYFPARNSCLQVVCSGFHDVIGPPRACTPEQTAHAEGWMDILGIAVYGGQLFKQVPESIQRLTLLARALVKDPPLLIFDEPCQGLDDRQKQHFKQVIDTLCSIMELTLIFVTHYQEEIPSAVTKVLRLEKGKVVGT
jgi:molybdate transport system ATP-binding protein